MLNSEIPLTLKKDLIASLSNAGRIIRNYNKIVKS